MSRRLKLVFGLVALQAIALLAVLSITFWTSQDQLLRFSEGYASRISRDATAYTEGFLEPANETAELTQRLLESGLLDPNDRSAMQRYFLELLSVHDTIDGVYLGEETGDFVYASRAAFGDPAPFRVKRVATTPERRVSYNWFSNGLGSVKTETDIQDEYDPRTRPWYKAALAANGAAWTSPYIFFSSKAPGITVAIPVTDGRDTSTIGAVGVDIKIAELSNFLASLDISLRGRAAILADNGDIIAHSVDSLTINAGNAAVFQSVVEGSDRILAEAVAQIEGGLDTLFPGEIRLARFEAEGEVWMGSVMRLELERTPWTVVTYLPESDILAPLNRVARIALMLSLIALVVTAALGFAYGRRVMNQPKT